MCFWKALAGKRDHSSKIFIRLSGDMNVSVVLAGCLKAHRKAVSLGIRGQCFSQREKNDIKWSKTKLLLRLNWCEGVFGAREATL